MKGSAGEALHVPQIITAEFGEKVKRSVQDLVKIEYTEYYPEVFISYATGRRGDTDAEGKERLFV